MNTVLIIPERESGFDLAAIDQDDFLDLANSGGITGDNTGVVDTCRNMGDVGYKNNGYKSKRIYRYS